MTEHEPAMVQRMICHILARVEALCPCEAVFVVCRYGALETAASLSVVGRCWEAGGMTDQNKYHRLTIDLEVEVSDPDALARFTMKVSPEGVSAPVDTQEQVRAAVQRLLGVFPQNSDDSGLKPLLAVVTPREVDQEGNYAETTLARQGGRDEAGMRRRL